MAATIWNSYAQSQLQQPLPGTSIQDILFGTPGGDGVAPQPGIFGRGDPGFQEGTSDVLDALNLGIGGDSILGPILGLVSRNRAASDLAAANDRTNAANEARYSQILGLNTQQQQLAQNQLNQTGQYYANRIPQVQAEFDKAGADIARQGQTARRDILSAGTAASGRAAQAARAGGITGGNLDRQARFREGVNTQRSLADLNERLGGLRSNLGFQRAATLANTTGDLGRFMQNRTGLETGLLGDRAGAIERRTDQVDLRSLLPYLMQSKGTGSSGGKKAGSILGPLLGIAGTAVGGPVGGMAGGMLGGMIGGGM